MNELNHDAKNWTDNTMAYMGVVILCSVLTYIPLLFPISVIRFAFYGGIAFSLYSKGKPHGKAWLCAFPLLAGFIDVMPGLSIIPFVPSIINIAGILVTHLQTKDKHNVSIESHDSSKAA